MCPDFRAPLRAGLLAAALWGGLAAWPGQGAALAGQPAEFWIAPERYEIAAEDPVVANLRTGRRFQGEALGFAPGGLLRFELLSGEARLPVEGISGDLPAVDLKAPGEGLTIVVHESTGPVLLWQEWAAFTAFVNECDFSWAIEDHHDRGLPDSGFRQGSLRLAKALIAVGSGAGQDRPVGLETEIVALANPYADDLTDGLPLLVLYQGKALKSTRITVHSRDPEGLIARRVRWTDMEGKLTISVTPGNEYLVNAVVLRPLPGTGKDSAPVWEALWTSLTFQAAEAP